MGQNSDGVMIYGREDEDGLIRVTCTAENLDYQAWLNPSTLPSNSSIPTTPQAGE